MSIVFFEIMKYFCLKCQNLLANHFITIKIFFQYVAFVPLAARLKNNRCRRKRQQSATNRFCKRFTCPQNIHTGKPVPGKLLRFCMAATHPKPGIQIPIVSAECFVWKFAFKIDWPVRRLSGSCIKKPASAADAGGAARKRTSPLLHNAEEGLLVGYISGERIRVLSHSKRLAW